MYEYITILAIIRHIAQKDVVLRFNFIGYYCIVIMSTDIFFIKKKN